MSEKPPTNDSIAWKAYRTNLHQFVLKRVNDPSTADDIVQDVLVKVYTHLDTLDDRDKLRQWMYQIARNTIVDYYRKHQPVEALPDSLPALKSTTDEDVEAEIARCIVPFIEKLPPHYRQAVMLSEIRGITQRKVAEKQGISLSGAKSRIQRGRKMIKAMLLECCQFGLDYRGKIINYESEGNCCEAKCDSPPLAN